MLNARNKRSSVIATLAALTAGLSCMASAQLGFLKNAPTGNLDEQDVKLMRDATGAILASSDPQAVRTWQNPASGNSGKISALSQFNTDDHRECRRLRLDTHTKLGGDSTSTMNVCRATGGKWLLDPDARPTAAQP